VVGGIFPRQGWRQATKFSWERRATDVKEGEEGENGVKVDFAIEI
jgi:hypothetical protein